MIEPAGTSGVGAEWGDFWRDSLGQLMNVGTGILARRNDVEPPAPMVIYQPAPPPAPAPGLFGNIPPVVLLGGAALAVFLLMRK